MIFTKLEFLPGFGIFRICTEPPYFQEFFRLSSEPKKSLYLSKKIGKKSKFFFFLGRDLGEKNFFFGLQLTYEDDDFIRINKEETEFHIF